MLGNFILFYFCSHVTQHDKPSQRPDFSVVIDTLAVLLKAEAPATNSAINTALLKKWKNMYKSVVEN